MWTVKQAAEFLGLKPGTVYKLCKDGKLRCYRLASAAIRIKQEDVEAYLESCLWQAPVPKVNKNVNLRRLRV